MKLTPEQKSALKNFLQSPQWETVRFLADEYIDRVRTGSSVKDTEWETAVSILSKENKEAGVREFIQELFNSAS